MSQFSRRQLFKNTSALGAASLFLNARAFSQEDAPKPRSNRFLLYIHFGSSCGMANGLIQPLKANEWPAGFFQRGAAGGAANPLLNLHTQAGGLIFHDYNKFLAPMANDMCLVSGTPQALDHGAAANLQMRGSTIPSAGTEWPMGVAEFMRTDTNKNPLVISGGEKTISVPSIATVSASSLAQFQTITTDQAQLRTPASAPIWEVLKKRFKESKSDVLEIDASIGANANYQLNTLFNGMPQIAAAKDHQTALTSFLANDKLNALIAPCADKAGIAPQMTNGFREQLILAGMMAKTGIASGMTISTIGDDFHDGGADVLSARNAAGRWALIAQFWEWIKSVNLQEDVMIIVGQEFARSPYNDSFKDIEIVNAQGAKQMVKSFGRDHGLCMGTMFINAKVPKAGRIGIVNSNLVPQATKDAKGTIDDKGSAYVSENIVGSMLMRVFDDLFPTERMVRKHWPSFIEIPAILA